MRGNFSRGGRGGAYYRNKYGGGRGGGRQSEAAMPVSRGGDQNNQGYVDSGDAREANELRQLLQNIDRSSYGAYKRLNGYWKLSCNCGVFTLAIDHVQSDPYAEPTRAHVKVDELTAGFPNWATSTKIRETAFCDFLTRRFVMIAKAIGADQRTWSNKWGGSKGGEISINAPLQHVIERTSVVFSRDQRSIEARFRVGLPAQGRSVLGGWATQILLESVPRIVERSLCASSINLNDLKAHCDSVEDQEYLRNQLSRAGIACFVRNGAILPRKSGVDDSPMPADLAVPFQSPSTLEKTFTLPHRGEVTGMALTKGISLIVGGGFHGKSCLLNALEKGVYNHIPGDGREFVCVSSRANKIRAEDGRSVVNVDITPFITNLPYGKKTDHFSTQDASGSTSQAASIVESIEAGVDTLLMDEDSCATNFMIRDDRMAKLVADDKEPIKPFIKKVDALYKEHGISTIIVMGGCGDYFSVANTVLMMDMYIPRDVTVQAKKIADDAGGYSDQNLKYGSIASRFLLPDGLFSQNENKVSVRGLHTVQYGNNTLSLSGVEQLVEIGQVRSIVDIVEWLVSNKKLSHTKTFEQILDTVDNHIKALGLDCIATFPKSGSLVLPRRLDIAAALNRCRTAHFIGK